MDQEQVIAKLKEKLSMHLRSHADVHQDPYKRDIFELFKEAYSRGYFEPSSAILCTGEALRIYFQENWASDDKSDERRSRLLNDVFAMWDEWKYALDQS